MEDWGPPLPPRKPAGLPSEVYIQHPGYITAGDAIQFNCMIRDRNLDHYWAQRIMTVRHISVFGPDDFDHKRERKPESRKQVSLDELYNRPHDIWVDTQNPNRLRYTHVRQLTRATQDALKSGGVVQNTKQVKGAIL